MAKLTLADIASGYAFISTYNDNNALLEAALEKTLSRDGTTPNSMSAPLDMNSNAINNIATPVNDNDVSTKGYVDSVVLGFTSGSTEFSTGLPYDITGAWDFNTLVDFTAGARFLDAGETDHMIVSHDGTDLNLAFTQTTAINFRDGVSLRIMDSGDTDYVGFTHDGTDLNVVGVNTGFISIDDVNLKMNDGTSIWMYDDDLTNIVTFNHDGSDDFEIALTNVNKLQFIGAAVGYEFYDAGLYIEEQASANADTATLGQVWVQNDVPNTLAYTDDSGTDFRVSCVQWFDKFGGLQLVNNTSTFVNITGLSGFKLDANSVYHIEILLKVIQASNAPDIKVRLNRQGAGTFTSEQFQITSIAATGAFTFQDVNVHTVLGATQSVTGAHSLHIIGVVDVGAGDVWDLQFAQNTPTVADTTVDTASYVKITKIGPGP